ncbi:MAG TPA: cupin domain-containing protein [Bryobacteraceae bacterium]|nr:cupin domain-containing protein [Bryobacteraceae bacterium]
MKLAGDVQVEVLLSSRDTGGRYAICRIAASASARSPKYTHAWEDMYFYVLSGRVWFEIGEREVAAEPGAGVFIPRHTPRALRCDGAARVLVISHPGGVDLFFEDLSRRSAADASILDKHGIGL